MREHLAGARPRPPVASAKMPDVHAWPEPTIVRVADGVFGPIDLAVHERGPADGLPVVLVHGFPELAYSWRHQLDALGDAGHRVIAPDMRGYGRSSRPHDVEAYGAAHLAGDLDGLLSALDLDAAVFVGHDWGGFITWAMPHLYPSRVLGNVGVCTPYMGFAPTPVLRSVFTRDEDLYILWFQEDGVAESVMDDRVEEIFTRLLRRNIDPSLVAGRATSDTGRLVMNPFLDSSTDAAAEPLGDPLGSADDLAFYVDTFRRTGFRGGINWYRNIDANGAVIPDVGVTDLPHPCLMLTAEWDFALRPEMADPMMAVLSDVERHDIPRAGHWVMQDQPEAVNAHLLDWLGRRFA